MSENISLRQALEVASSGKREAVVDFLRRFLAGRVYIPLRLRPGEGVSSQKLQVNTQYLLLEQGSEKRVPIFSEAAFISEWAGREIPYEEREVKALLWNVAENITLHLNPGQEFGKEFSAWEIAQLRAGEEAIDAIADELCEAESVDFEVLENEIPEQLKKRLTVLFESYPSVKEAFYLVLKSCQDQVSSPVIGLKLAEIQLTKQQQLIAEVREEVRMSMELGSQMGELALFDDLASEHSPNRKIFQEATPFYFASKAFNLNPRPVGFFDGLKKMFRKESS